MLVRSKGTVAAFGKATDFVLAVRLMKISKGLSGSGLSMNTKVKGATFSLGDAEEKEAEVKDVLVSEGFDAAPGVRFYE
jgi:hypothetical protein